MLLKRPIQAIPFGNVFGHDGDDLSQARILRLIFHDLEQPHDGYAGFQHGPELLGKEDQFLGTDRGKAIAEAHLLRAHG